MRRNLPQSIPAGRLGELRGREDAHLIAYRVGKRWDAEYTLRRFNSRAALEAFCKSGSAMHALVKTEVPGPMVVNRNIQREAAANASEGRAS